MMNNGDNSNQNPANTNWQQDQPDPLAGTAHARSMVCSECGGQMVWAKPYTQSSSVYMIPFSTGAGLFGGNMVSTIALVCINCGFSKLFTTEPRRLVE